MASSNTLDPNNRSSMRHYIRETAYWFALIAAVFFFMFPLYWMVITSLKPRADVERRPDSSQPEGV